MRLEEFDYQIQYKKGKENAVADALSRIEINTKETVEADDLDLLSILLQLDEDELTPEEADEILREETLEDDDANTQHTVIENPTFALPISDKPLNHSSSN